MTQNVKNISKNQFVIPQHALSLVRKAIERNSNQQETDLHVNLPPMNPSLVKDFNEQSLDLNDVKCHLVYVGKMIDVMSHEKVSNEPYPKTFFCMKYLSYTYDLMKSNKNAKYALEERTSSINTFILLGVCQDIPFGHYIGDVQAKNYKGKDVLVCNVKEIYDKNGSTEESLKKRAARTNSDGLGCVVEGIVSVHIVVHEYLQKFLNHLIDSGLQVHVYSSDVAYNVRDIEIDRVLRRIVKSHNKVKLSRSEILNSKICDLDLSDITMSALMDICRPCPSSEKTCSVNCLINDNANDCVDARLVGFLEYLNECYLDGLPNEEKESLKIRLGAANLKLKSLKRIHPYVYQALLLQVPILRVCVKMIATGSSFEGKKGHFLDRTFIVKQSINNHSDNAMLDFLANCNKTINVKENTMFELRDKLNTAKVHKKLSAPLLSDLKALVRRPDFKRNPNIAISKHLQNSNISDDFRKLISQRAKNLTRLITLISDISPGSVSMFLTDIFETAHSNSIVNNILSYETDIGLTNIDITEAKLLFNDAILKYAQINSPRNIQKSGPIPCYWKKISPENLTAFDLEFKENIIKACKRGEDCTIDGYVLFYTRSNVTPEMLTGRSDVKTKSNASGKQVFPRLNLNTYIPTCNVDMTCEEGYLDGIKIESDDESEASAIRRTSYKDLNQLMNELLKNNYMPRFACNIREKLIRSIEFISFKKRSIDEAMLYDDESEQHIQTPLKSSKYITEEKATNLIKSDWDNLFN